MKPGAIAAAIIAVIIVVKDPGLISQIINGIVAIFNSGSAHG